MAISSLSHVAHASTLQKEIDKAKEVLNKVHSQIYDILGTRTLMVDIANLEYMTDDPQSVDVMYLGVSTPQQPDVLSHIASMCTLQADLQRPLDRALALRLIGLACDIRIARG
jgi:hypothetical protein